MTAPTRSYSRQMTLEMTMNVYGHVSLDEKRDALDKVGELFREGS